jgi:hypothetical protein
MNWYENRDRACYDADTEIWYPDPQNHSAVAYAVKLCNTCPVRQACLDDQMAFEQGLGKISRVGIFGGLTPRERFDLERSGQTPNRPSNCQNPRCGEPIDTRGTRRKYCSRRCLEVANYAKRAVA